MDQESRELLDTIAQTIFDKKGFNILVLDVSPISTLTDFFVIAEGNVGRHIAAISQAIKAALMDKGLRPIAIEGEETGDWVVLDYGNIIIHLFQPVLREKYSLEELWREGEVVDARIQVPERPQRVIGER